MVIRRLKKDEWQAAMMLVWRTFLRHVAPDYEKEGVKSFYEFVTDPDLETMFVVGEYIVFGAFDDGQLVGISSTRGGNFLSLLFVDNDYHRKGLGTQLLGAVADYVREVNHKRDLIVYSSPYAVEFYHQMGFIDDGDVRRESGMLVYPMRLRL